MSQLSESQNASCLQRELAVVRVLAEGELQDAALNVVGAWSGRLLELGADHFTAEVSAHPEKISRFLAALAPLGLSATFRSGVVSLV